FDALNQTFSAPGSAAAPTKRRVPEPSVPTTTSPGWSFGSMRNCRGMACSLCGDPLGLEEVFVDDPPSRRVGLVGDAVHSLDNLARLRCVVVQLVGAEVAQRVPRALGERIRVRIVVRQ